MQALLRRFNIERGYQLSLQIGIHSGDIVAGIVGKSRVVYDIWGDTVKQAHTLSQSCPAGAVVVSEVVHHRLEDLYSFESAHGAGDVQSWRLTSAKVVASLS
jgi:class 3 adenylate cyclase